MDEGHRIRLELIKNEMVKAIDTLDELHSRAYRLYMPDALHDTDISSFDSDLQDRPIQSTKEVADTVQSLDRLDQFFGGEKRLPALPTVSTGDEDLVDMSHAM